MMLDFKVGGMKKKNGMDRIYKELCDHVRSYGKLQLHMTGLTKTLLGWERTWQFPTGNWFKGDDTRTILHFLEERFEALVAVGTEPPEYFGAVLEAIKGANHFMHVIYNAGLWLTDSEANRCIQSLSRFLKYYQVCATLAYERKNPRFRLSPKYHSAAEVLFDIMHAKAGNVQGLNPLAWSTQIDEDFVGRVATFSRAVSSRTVHFKTVQRYKLSLGVQWRWIFTFIVVALIFAFI